MTEPRRLLDETGDDFMRDLLSSAEDDVPDAAARSQTLAQLASGAALVGAATGGAGAATGGAGAPGLFGTAALKWLVLLVVAGVLVALLTRPSNDEPRSAPATNMQTAPVSPVVPRAAASEQAAAAAPSATSAAAMAPAPAVSAAALLSAAPTTSMTAVPQAREVGLAEETKMLDEARAALAKGDARAALVVLDRYDREAKRRMLGPEATMVRIEALNARGDAAAARALARRFLGQNPGSAYEDRVRSLLGETPPQ